MKKLTFILFAALCSLSLAAQAQTSATAHCGDSALITATPLPGYKFVKWTDGNTQNPRKIEVDATFQPTTTFTAEFAPANYTIKLNVNEEGWGTVSGAGSFGYGEQVQISATAAEPCYKFVKWSDGNTDNPRTITVGATDVGNTYTAVFEEVDFTVQVTVNNTSYGSVTIQKLIE